MRNKNNIKSAAAFTVPAALLIVLAPNNTVAAPNDKVPIVSPLVAAKTVQLTMSIQMIYLDYKTAPPSNSIVEQMTVQKPNKYRITITGNNTWEGIQNKIDVSDGRTLTQYNAVTNQYQQMPASTQYDVFTFTGKIPATEPISVVWDGRKCLLYTIPPDPQTPYYRILTHLWIDAVTHLPVYQTVDRLNGDTAWLTVQTKYTNWKLNPKLPVSVFNFVPPSGAKLIPNDSIPPPPVPPVQSHNSAKP